MTVITIVRGEVPAAQQRTFEEGFSHIKDRTIPDGLITTRLLHDEDNPTHYLVESSWDDRASFEQFRHQTNPLPAFALFHQAGSQATLNIFDIADELIPTLV